MTKLYILVFFILIYASKLYSTNIAIIDINFLINNSKHFIEISKKINNSQKKFTENFENTEKSLIESKEELENSKLILSEEEFNLRKDEYYNQVSKFEQNVSKFNIHYENQISKIKNILFAKISELLQLYASKNNIDLILEKNQYLIAAEKINISKIIFKKLNESDINLSFEAYED